jgi:hypothetical protein
LFSHQETVVAILKNRSALASGNAMHELELMTSIMAYLAAIDRFLNLR